MSERRRLDHAAVLAQSLPSRPPTVPRKARPPPLVRTRRSSQRSASVQRPHGLRGNSTTGPARPSEHHAPLNKEGALTGSPCSLHAPRASFGWRGGPGVAPVRLEAHRSMRACEHRATPIRAGRCPPRPALRAPCATRCTAVAALTTPLGPPSRSNCARRSQRSRTSRGNEGAGARTPRERVA